MERDSSSGISYDSSLDGASVGPNDVFYGEGSLPVSPSNESVLGAESAGEKIVISQLIKEFADGQHDKFIEALSKTNLKQKVMILQDPTFESALQKKDPFDEDLEYLFDAINNTVAHVVENISVLDIEQQREVLQNNVVIDTVSALVDADDESELHEFVGGAIARVSHAASKKLEGKKLLKIFGFEFVPNQLTEAIRADLIEIFKRNDVIADAFIDERDKIIDNEGKDKEIAAPESLPPSSSRSMGEDVDRQPYSARHNNTPAVPSSAEKKQEGGGFFDTITSALGVVVERVTSPRYFFPSSGGRYFGETVSFLSTADDPPPSFDKIYKPKSVSDFKLQPAPKERPKRCADASADGDVKGNKKSRVEKEVVGPVTANVVSSRNTGVCGRSFSDGSL